MGKLREAWRKSKMRNGVEIAGRTTAHVLLTIPARANMRKSGIMVAANGIIIAINNTPMRRSFVREWKISNE